VIVLREGTKKDLRNVLAIAKVDRPREEIRLRSQVNIYLLELEEQYTKFKSRSPAAKLLPGAELISASVGHFDRLLFLFLGIGITAPASMDAFHASGKVIPVSFISTEILQQIKMCKCLPSFSSASL
jgi:hypothetical protein